MSKGLFILRSTVLLSTAIFNGSSLFPKVPPSQQKYTSGNSVSQIYRRTTSQNCVSQTHRPTSSPIEHNGHDSQAAKSNEPCTMIHNMSSRIHPKSQIHGTNCTTALANSALLRIGGHNTENTFLFFVFFFFF